MACATLPRPHETAVDICVQRPYSLGMLAFNIVALVLLGTLFLGALLGALAHHGEANAGFGLSIIVGFITAVAIAALALNMAAV